jgi:hypothetical protein
MNRYVKELRIIDRGSQVRPPVRDHREVARHAHLESDYYRMIREQRLKEEQQSSMEYTFAATVGPDSDGGGDSSKNNFSLFLELL